MSSAAKALLRGASSVLDIKGRSTGRPHEPRADVVTEAWEMVGREMRTATREVRPRAPKRAR